MEEKEKMPEAEVALEDAEKAAPVEASAEEDAETIETTKKDPEAEAVPENKTEGEKEAASASLDSKPEADQPEAGNAEEEKNEEEKAHKAVKVITGLLALCVAGAGGYGYYYHTQKVSYYADHFLKGTCNEIDITGLTVDEAADLVENTLQYELSVTGRDEKGEDITEVIGKEEIGLSFHAKEALTEALAGQDSAHWYNYEYRGAQDVVELEESYDKDLLDAAIQGLSVMNLKDAMEPENAYRTYNEESRRYEVVPDTASTIFDKAVFADRIRDAVEERAAEADAEDLYQVAEITADDEKLNALVDQANKMLSTCVTIQYDEKQEVVDDTVISEYLLFDEENNEVKLDEEGMRKYINAHFDKTFDSKGRTRTFVSAGSGKTISIGGGTYGSVISTDLEIEKLLEEIAEGVTETREPLWRVEEKGTENDGIGNDYVEIDIPAQKVYVVMNGEVVFTTSCVTGTADGNRDTPTGIYTVNWMKRNHHMKKYNVDVDYWMLFENSEGVGFHDAKWRGEFGGSIYQYSGSHGCVNLPLSSAATMFSIIYTGIPVVSHK